MKKLAVLILLLIGSFGYSQTLDCSKIKNGKFYHSEYPNKSFIIKDNLQENYNNGELKIVWDLKWITECEYELICIKVFGENVIQPGDKIIATITSIDNKCYTCKRTFYSKDFPNGDVDPGSTFCIKND
jgi:hypothetical protein